MMAVAKSKAAKKPAGPHLKLERECAGPEGLLHVCGVDEAGRGPWAGPVYAGAVILHPRRPIKGLNDSKKLTAKSREALELEIKAKALAWGLGHATVGEIAELNILHATGLAMCRAIEALAVRPAIALVDGNYRFPLPCDVRTVIGGDALSKSIAAASILAKVARDRVMIAMDVEHPGYGFASHKGYRAAVHARALLELGPCPEHRRAWGPVKLALLGKDPMQAYEDAFQDELPLVAAE
jgi:ribonuclease HII